MELLATLFLFRLVLSKLRNRERIHLHVPLTTDNQGNAYSILNSKTKKWPNSALMMELDAQTMVAGVGLVIEHQKRDFNQWADQLAHSDYSGFCPQKRIAITGTGDCWIVLPELLRRFANDQEDNRAN